jgi:DNA helicase-2/ATP-dependent DNA helicase PcrA
MDFCSGLNPNQEAAVCHTEGPLLVLAGAGSGKTRVLTHRIAHLVKDLGVSPWSIIAITFTNKAASEMRQRVSDLLGNQAGEMVWVSTFHSACVRILRRELAGIGLNPHFTIYDSDDQQKLMKQCIKELDFDDKQMSANMVLSRISRAKSELISAAAYDTTAEDFVDEKVARLYLLYQSKLEAANAFDFDDLLMRVVNIFQEYPRVLEYYQDKLQYVMVDEYQDTNRAQYEFSRLLAGKHRNIFVVGDDDQSIYGWRGADIRNILDFEQDFPDAKVIKLTENYRSTKTILDAANGVVQNNRSRMGKELWTKGPEGEKVAISGVADDLMEALGIAREIDRLVQEEGKKYSDVAILYRMNSQSRSLEERFVMLGIPYQIVGGVRFYQRKEVKDILAYLRMLINQDDDIAFARVVNVPRRGIGDTTLSALAKFARLQGGSQWQALGKLDDEPTIRDRGRKSLLDFYQLIQVLQKEKDQLILPDLVEAVYEKSGYRAELEREGTNEATARIENLGELISVARDFYERSEEKTLEAFLYDVSLVSDVDALANEDGQVTLMTLHCAKGLEFPVVFIAGMEDGIFPHVRALSSEPEMEEERRLCYVGITRAKERLYLSFAGRRFISGSEAWNRPSRFLHEIPVHLCDQPAVPVQTPTRQVDKDAWKKPEIRPAPDGSEKWSLEAGDRVTHGKWGDGTVVSIKGTGENMEVAVAFALNGVKKLMVAYAPLIKR